MKKILLINLYLVFFSVLFAQTPQTDLNKGFVAGNHNFSKDTTVHFKTVCLPALKKKDEPLIVVDGIIYESNELKKINPDEIESISIVKESGLIFSCRPLKEVIIITTKNAHKKNFIVRDNDERVGIASATIIAVSEDKKDTVSFVADEFGKIETFKLKAADYKLRISCAGYKTKEISLKEAATNQYEILLVKEKIELTEILIVGGTKIICRQICCCGLIYKSNIDSSVICKKTNSFKKSERLKVFPNPVKAGAFVNIQLPDQMPVEFSVRLISASGQQVILNENEIKLSGRQIVFQIKPQLSAGVYFVQLVSKNKKLVSSGKIILL